MKKITQKELDQILKQHQFWLDSKGKKGERADLRGANLRGIDLKDADLRYVDFNEADLYTADLRGADLRGADLRYSKLIDADLSYTDLREADLREADLYLANLRGADLTNAHLTNVHLNNADLTNTSVKTFKVGNYFGFFHESYVQIGCQGHKLDYWLKNAESLASIHDISPLDYKTLKSIVAVLAEEYKK